MLRPPQPICTNTSAMTQQFADTQSLTVWSSHTRPSLGTPQPHPCLLLATLQTPIRTHPRPQSQSCTSPCPCEEGLLLPIIHTLSNHQRVATTHNNNPSTHTHTHTHTPNEYTPIKPSPWQLSTFSGECIIACHAHLSDRVPPYPRLYRPSRFV